MPSRLAVLVDVAPSRNKENPQMLPERKCPDDAVIWEARIIAHLREHGDGDAAHDLGHLRRVLTMARRIAEEEGLHDRLALTAAALLHDCVSVAKDSPLRSKASYLASEEASRLLHTMGFPTASLGSVQHAILAHSFSAGVQATTPEARAVQDADRLDSLGAIGAARCFAVSGTLGRALFDQDDPLAANRPLDDLAWGLDHFMTKLFKLPGTMKTATGRRIAESRARWLEEFMFQIEREASGVD